MVSSTYLSTDEDSMQLTEMSLSKQLSDYERNVNVTRSGQRHDTITVENEGGLKELVPSLNTSTGSSFDVVFSSSKPNATVSNSPKKVQVEREFFQHVRIARPFNASCQHGSWLIPGQNLQMVYVKCACTNIICTRVVSQRDEAKIGISVKYCRCMHLIKKCYATPCFMYII